VIISIEKHHGGHCSESHTSTDSDGKKLFLPRGTNSTTIQDTWLDKNSQSVYFVFFKIISLGQRSNFHSSNKKRMNRIILYWAGN